jgi:carbon storage regulator
MFFASRKKNEGLVIGDSIIVTVVEVRGDKVRLGIELPKEMSLHRKEVFDAIHRHEATSPSQAEVREEL